MHIIQKFGGNDAEMEGWVQNYSEDLKAYSMVTTVEKYVETGLNAVASKAKYDHDITATPPSKRAKYDRDVAVIPPAKRTRNDHNVTATPPAKRAKYDCNIADTLPANLAKYDSRYCCPVEWKTNFNDHSLNHLTEVWKLFSSHYLKPDSPQTALLDHVHKGASLVTWLVPSGLISSLIKRVQNDSDFLRQHRILRMTVEGRCVYEEVTMVSLQCSCCLYFIC